MREISEINNEEKSYYYEIVKKPIRLGEIATAAIWNCSLCDGTISGMGGPGSSNQICGYCGDAITSGKGVLTR